MTKIKYFEKFYSDTCIVHVLHNFGMFFVIVLFESTYMHRYILNRSNWKWSCISPRFFVCCLLLCVWHWHSDVYQQCYHDFLGLSPKKDTKYRDKSAKNIVCSTIDNKCSTGIPTYETAYQRSSHIAHVFVTIVSTNMLRSSYFCAIATLNYQK